MKIYLYTLIFLIALTSCGFKPLNQLKQESYFVEKVELSGDKRIGYVIKNEISLNSFPGAKNIISVKLDVNKRKEIKEKNVAGNISSYNIILDIDFYLENMENSKKIEKKFTKSASYDVADNHSDTLSNEKNTTKNLSEETTKDIINFLTIYLSN